MAARYTRFLSMTLLCGSMVLCASAGLADDAGRTARSHIVSSAGLNLSEDQGVQALYERIRRAARQVCERGQRLTLSNVIEERECRAEAITHAVAQIKDAKLAAHHREMAQSHGG